MVDNPDINVKCVIIAVIVNFKYQLKVSFCVNFNILGSGLDYWFRKADCVCFGDFVNTNLSMKSKFYKLYKIMFLKLKQQVITFALRLQLPTGIKI